MESGNKADGGREQGATRPSSHLFTVRLWKQDDADGSEYRGSVREVMSGAFRHFRDWSELAAFMAAQIEEDERADYFQTNGNSQPGQRP